MYIFSADNDEGNASVVTAVAGTTHNGKAGDGEDVKEDGDEGAKAMLADETDRGNEVGVEGGKDQRAKAVMLCATGCMGVRAIDGDNMCRVAPLARAMCPPSDDGSCSAWDCQKGVPSAPERRLVIRIGIPSCNAQNAASDTGHPVGASL